MSAMKRLKQHLRQILSKAISLDKKKQNEGGFTMNCTPNYQRYLKNDKKENDEDELPLL